MLNLDVAGQMDFGYERAVNTSHVHLQTGFVNNGYFIEVQLL